MSQWPDLQNQFSSGVLSALLWRYAQIVGEDLDLATGRSSVPSKRSENNSSLRPRGQTEVIDAVSFTTTLFSGL